MCPGTGTTHHHDSMVCKGVVLMPGKSCGGVVVGVAVGVSVIGKGSGSGWLLGGWYGSGDAVGEVGRNCYGCGWWLWVVVAVIFSPFSWVVWVLR